MKKIIFILLVCILLISVSCNEDKDFPKYHFDGNKFVLTEESNDEIGISNLESVEELDIKINNSHSFILFIYNKQCEASNAFKIVLEAFVENHQLVIYSLENTLSLKETWMKKQVMFVPTILIFREGKIIAQLNPYDNDHRHYFQNVNDFEIWFYTYIKKH